MEVGSINFEASPISMRVALLIIIGRKHVNADLRPYICLEPDCLTSEQQYTKRHEWLEHLNQKHWRVFRCPYSCRAADFASPSHLGNHIRQSHPELSSQRDLGMIFDLCERPMPWPEEIKCPLCLETLRSKREYGRHVGRHQTELALFALPSIGEEIEEEWNENHDSDDAQQLNRAEYPIGDGSNSEESELSDGDPESGHTPDPLGQSGSLIEPGKSSTSETSGKSFICQECGRFFDQVHKLNHHKRYHDRAHQCPYPECDKKFGTKTHLVRHIESRHPKSKGYHCPHASCIWAKGGKSFLRKDNLRRHLTRQHGYTLESAEKSIIDLDPTLISGVLTQSRTLSSCISYLYRAFLLSNAHYLRRNLIYEL
jgi:hypothetical protein